MNKNLPSIFSDFDSIFFRPARFLGNVINEELSGISVDVIEKEDGYELKAQLPGFTKEEVKVDLKDKYLTISASKTISNEDKNERYLRKEISTKSVSRSFYLHDDISQNPSEIIAKMEHGILNLVIPKKKPEQIEASSIKIE